MIRNNFLPAARFVFEIIKSTVGCASFKLLLVKKNLINKQKNFCAFGYNVKQAVSLNIKTAKYCFFKIVIDSLLEQQLKQIVEELLFFFLTSLIALFLSNAVARPMCPNKEIDGLYFVSDKSY